MSVRACVCVHVCACMCVRACVCVHVCVCVVVVVGRGLCVSRFVSKPTLDDFAVPTLS